LAAEAFSRAAEKLPIKVKVVARLGDNQPSDCGGLIMAKKDTSAKKDDIKLATDDQLSTQLSI